MNTENTGQLSQDKLMPFITSGTGFLVKPINSFDNGNLVTARSVADPSWDINNGDVYIDNDREMTNKIRLNADDLEQKYYKLKNVAPNPLRKYETHSVVVKYIPSGSVLNLNKNMTYSEQLAKIGISNCQVLRWSKDENINLAVLVTENNPGNKYIDLKKDANEKLQDVKIGSQVVALAYSGNITSKTRNQNSELVYKAQTSAVSRIPNNFEIHYDMSPALGMGAYGAPILNEKGKVIGVNANTTASSDIAIPIKHVLAVMNFEQVFTNNQNKIR